MFDRKTTNLHLMLAMLASVTSVYAGFQGLEKGVMDGEPSYDFLDEKIYALGYFPNSITVTDNPDILYYYSDKLARFDNKNGVLIGAWAPKRHPQDYIEPEYQSWLDSEFDGGREGLLYSPSDAASTLGCLGGAPLRYGDINHDGNSELVLYLNNNLLVFSTVKNKVIFSTSLAIDDWVQVDLSDLLYVNQNSSERDPLPQYQSSKGMSENRLYLDGYRGYSKLYLGDFNQDNLHDIVVWRKLYVSHKERDTDVSGNPLVGFKKIKDTWLHYTLMSSDYHLQNTSQEKVIQWLSENKQTWQSGYPHFSECKGEEGEPITELYDAELNDPDVLE